MQPHAAKQPTVTMETSSSTGHRTPAIRVPAHTREPPVITGGRYWTFRETSTSANPTWGCIPVSRGNATHGPAVAGLPGDQRVRDADGDTVLATRAEVLQNLSSLKLNNLEGKRGNGGRKEREEEEKNLAGAEPWCPPHRWRRSSGCSAETRRSPSGLPRGAGGPRKGLRHRASASAEAGPDELRGERAGGEGVPTQEPTSSGPAGPLTVPHGIKGFVL